MSNISLTSLPKSTITDSQFYELIDRLKSQGALPRESFQNTVAFFTFTNTTKETQVRELFQDASDPNLYKNLLKNIVSNQESSDSSNLVSKRLSVMQVMGFAQIILYKVLPCQDPECPNKPREIATHNQYKDYEYQCPFYHHWRDMRRLVITNNLGEEFIYKANYYEDGKKQSEKDKYSQNYFESMFHPLYYKMFRCKREYCNFSQLCPFYHSEEEKKTWDKTFSNFIRKDRISYVKDKFKYFEKEDAKKKGGHYGSKTSKEKTVDPSKWTESGKLEKSVKGDWEEDLRRKESEKLMRKSEKLKKDSEIIDPAHLDFKNYDEMPISKSSVTSTQRTH